MSTGKCVNLSIFVIIIFLILLPTDRVRCQELVVLEIILNQESKGELFLFLSDDNDVLINREEFEGMGLKKGLGRDIQYDQDIYVSLKSVPDIEFRINEDDVTLEITAASHLFEKHDLNASYEKPYEVVFSKDRSAFLNYAVIYDDKSDESFLSASGELGLSIGDYFGMSTFSYDKTGDTGKAARLMSRLTFNDRERLRTLTFGDFTASSGLLGSSTLIGGINISKNFSLNPYMKRFPSFNISGTLETPSEVNVYMDGSLVKRENLSPGEFLFNDVPATVGLGAAEVVVKDVYGRESVISKPYYYSDRLLKKELNNYSYSIGFMRKKFGKESFSYDKPVFLGSHEFGLSERMKIGYGAEASDNLINAGPSMSFLAANAGVIDINMRLSTSSGENGVSGFLGYSFKSRNISANIFMRSDSEKYSSLLIGASDDKARFKFGGAMGFGQEMLGHITAGYSYYDMYNGDTVSRADISYSKSVSKRATLFINASETRDNGTAYDVFMGLHIYLDKGISANVSHTRSGDFESQRVGIQKSLPIGNGFGYRADAVSSDTKDYINGRLEYQTDSGIYNFDASNRYKNSGFGVSAAGGIGYIDNSFFFSRPIYDSFAKVKVKDLDDVKVYYYGNEVGRTSDGELIVPNMRSFHDNRIEIESRDIPLNYAIDTVSKYVSPPFRSGTVIEFNISKVQGITGILYAQENGEEVPVEFATVSIYVNDNMIEGLVGLDGEFYFENIPSGEHTATVHYKEKKWACDLSIPDTDESIIDAGNIICREAE